MNYQTTDIASVLRAARDAKSLSQRDLSKLVGLPQSHISKIESGGVDLRVSSLVAIARALDHELTLVPLKSIPAVHAVIRSTSDAGRGVRAPAPTRLKEFARIDSRLAELTRLFPSSIELAQLGRQIRDLQHLPLTKEDRGTLNDVYAVLVQARRKKNLEPIRSALATLQHLRDEIVHGRLRVPPAEKVRPAYSLDDADNE